MKESQMKCWGYQREIWKSVIRPQGMDPMKDHESMNIRAQNPNSIKEEIECAMGAPR